MGLASLTGGLVIGGNLLWEVLRGCMFRVCRVGLRTFLVMLGFDLEKTELYRGFFFRPRLGGELLKYLGLTTGGGFDGITASAVMN